MRYGGGAGGRNPEPLYEISRQFRNLNKLFKILTRAVEKVKKPIALSERRFKRGSKIPNFNQ